MTEIEAKPPKPSIGKIIRILYYGCGPSAQIWVTSAVPAALHLIWSLLPLDWKSEVKLVTGKSWLKHVKGTMREAEVFLPEALSTAQEALFVVAEIIDALSWYFYIASITSEFLVEWSTLAFERGAHDPASCVNVVKGEQPNGFHDSDDSWQLGPQWVETWPTPGQTLSSQVHIPNNESAWISCTFTATNTFSGKQVAIAIRIIDVTSGEIIIESSTSQEEADAGYSNILNVHIPSHTGARTLEVQWNKGPGNTALSFGCDTGYITIGSSGYNPIM